LSKVLYRDAQTAARGGVRCASQVIDRGSKGNTRGTAQLLDRGAQAFDRGAAR
jgi:hypothetical protein